MVFETKETLDTNVILRIMLDDVPQQGNEARMLLHRKGVEYEVADLAVTEAVYVMQSFGMSHEKIVANFRCLFKYLNIRANFGLFDKVFPMYLKRSSLSFNDCCLAAYAELNEAEPLWTFDKKLAKQAKNTKLVEDKA